MHLWRIAVMSLAIATMGVSIAHAADRKSQLSRGFGGSAKTTTLDDKSDEAIFAPIWQTVFTLPQHIASKMTAAELVGLGVVSAKPNICVKLPAPDATGELAPAYVTSAKACQPLADPKGSRASPCRSALEVKTPLDWRVSCRRDEKGNTTFFASREGVAPHLIGRALSRVEFFDPMALHDRLLIRTLETIGNGQASVTEYSWNPSEARTSAPAR